jgi:hypothetical protein
MEKTSLTITPNAVLVSERTECLLSLLLLKVDLRFQFLTSGFKSLLFLILRVPVAPISFFVVNLTLNHLEHFLIVEDFMVVRLANIFLLGAIACWAVQGVLDDRLADDNIVAGPVQGPRFAWGCNGKVGFMGAISVELDVPATHFDCIELRGCCECKLRCL